MWICKVVKTLDLATEISIFFKLHTFSGSMDYPSPFKSIACFQRKLKTYFMNDHYAFSTAVLLSYYVRSWKFTYNKIKNKSERLFVRFGRDAGRVRVKNGQR